MRHAPLRTCIALLLLFETGGAFGAAAQTADTTGRWHGKLGLTAGFGSRNIHGDGDPYEADTLYHNREEVMMQLGYTAPKFSFSTLVTGQRVEKETQFERESIKDQVTDLKFRQTSLRQPSGSARTDLQWKPSERNQFSTFVLYQIEQDKSLGGTMNLHYNAEEDDPIQMGLSTETRHFLKHRIHSGWRSTHLFPAQQLTLLTQLDGTTQLQQRNSVWEQSDFSNGKTYILTPESNVHEGKALALLRKDGFCGVRTLRFEAAMQARSTYTEDRNGGKTQIAPDVWRDSLRIQTKLSHLALWLEPGITVDYKTGAWHFRGEGTLQWYGERLTDDRHFRHLVWDSPVPVGRVLTEWTPSKMHTVSFSVSHAVKQPTYVQRCWFDRQDANPDQLFRGNPELKVSHNQELNLTYTFRHERFRASSQSRLTYRTHEVEQTFTNEEIDGRNYKVFTWLNTAFGETFSQVATAGWAGGIFSADTRLSYSQKRQQSALLDREVRTHHWEFSAEATCRPGKAWRLSARGAYVGDVKTLYSLLEGYCSLNARIEKTIKKVTVFVEGRDLLDQPVEKEFISEDLSERWHELEYLNRRVFLAGVTWSF